MVYERIMAGEKPAMSPTIDGLSKLTAKSVAEAAYAGDPLAKRIYEVSGEMLGRTLAIMIDLLVDEQLLIQRLIERGKSSGRADDNLNTIRHRIAVYHQQTEPIAHYYLHHGNYFAVNGNHTMADVFLQIMRIIENYGR